MKQRRKMGCLVFFLLVSMICSSQAQAGAVQDQISNAEKKIRELEDALNQTDQNISAYEKEQKELEQEVASGQEKISRLSAELDDTRSAITNTRDEIAKTVKALKSSREDSREQYAQMKQRIRFMYENSTTDLILYVLEAGSLSEALRRADYFQAVVSYDRQKLEEYRATTRKIKKEKTKLVEEKEKLETLETKQTEQLSGIDAAVADLKNKLSNKIAQIQSSEAMQKKYQQELEQQKQYEQELERKKAEEDSRRAEEIRRQEEELERKRQEEQERKKQEELERKKQEELERKRQEAQESQNQQDGQQSSVSGSSSDVSGNDSGSAPASAGDLELLSTIIYCEAGNQSYEGQLAVGSVIMNRVASGSFPNSISGVIYQSGQFSPVASGRFAHALAAGLGSRCRAAAQEVLNGNRNVDCLYFRVDNGMIDGLVIGNHVFY